MASKGKFTKATKNQRHSPYSKQKPSSAIQKSIKSNPSSFGKQFESAATQNENGTRVMDDANQLGHQEGSSTTCEVYPCISARQPYAGFILNGLKTIETRWMPIFKDLEGSTVAIHVAWRDWEGGEWRSFLQKERSDTEIDELKRDGERHGRGVVAGLVDVGETWQCPADATSENSEHIVDWENSALLRPLNEKFLTKVSNPRWLTRPVECKAKGRVWEVQIPTGYLP